MVQPPATDLHIYYLEGRIDPDWNPPDREFLGNWEEDGFSFLFFSKPARASVEILLDKHPRLTLLDEYHMRYDEWQGGKLEPMQVGRFTVVPPWCAHRCPPGPDRILLDPGVVFGNGTHPTTHACLEALEISYRRNKAETVVDLGTGTGLLALAAAHLGGQKIMAVDLNRLAALTAARNVHLNGFENQIVVLQADARDCLSRPSDLLIANIHFDVMTDIIGSRGFKQHKKFILSGLLRSQVRTAVLMLREQSCNIIKQWEDNGTWHTIYGRHLE